jgi:16S rRNA (cytosine967-C5)-methyltransferase
VRTLPGYVAGDFSVQDSAAQLAAQLLDVKPGQHILDACAAPGGKTAHILELVDNKATVIALDNSAARLERLQENLLRLKLSAKTIVADASHSNSWHKGEAFDRILCDAPCSALGVIRRHPDIAILRREDDIQKLIGLQQQILDDLWSLLKVGGILLYATCSILKVENALQVDNFLKRHHDAKLLEIKLKGADSLSLQSNTLGWQIYPGEQQMDGFYYAKLYKHEKSTEN